MNTIAVLKHLAIKKQDYTDIQNYLLFRCEPGTHKPLRDADGHMISRDFLIQDGINCSAFQFHSECTQTNRKWNKNHKKGEIIAHHFIISFDPKDAEEGRLIPQMAHELALEFARTFFDGHQMIIVTHADGNNHSGNIHTHIVINSLRKYAAERQPFMEHYRDSLPGYKYHLTEPLLHRMHEYLYSLCEREHLHNVDIFNPTNRKVNDREYRAQKRGQKAKDARSAEMRAAGVEPRATKYHTQKQWLRNCIDMILTNIDSTIGFIYLMDEKYDIIVKESRGRFSYLIPGQEKPISERSLGHAYEKKMIEERIELCRMPDLPIAPEHSVLPKVFHVQSEIRMITELQDCVKAQQSLAYAHKVTLSNIQQMANTLSWLTVNKVSSLAEIEHLTDAAVQEYTAARQELRQTESDLRKVNQDIRQLGIYLSRKKLYRQFLASENKAQFRAEHSADIDKYTKARDYLGKQYTGKFPSMAELKAQKAALVEKQKEQKARFLPAAAEYRKMNAIFHNVQYMLTSGYRARQRLQQEQSQYRQEIVRKKRRSGPSL